MRKLLPFLFIGLPVAAHAQSQQNLVSSSIYNYSSNTFNLIDSSEYKYASQRPAYLPLLDAWNSDTVYSYNAASAVKGRYRNKFTNGMLVEKNTDALTGGTWFNGERDLYTYDGNGKVASHEKWSYSVGLGTMRKQQKETWQYDGAGNITEYMFYVADPSMPSNPSFIPAYRNTYTYAGGKVSLSLQESYVMGAWENSGRTTYTYPNATTIEEVNESYNMGSWQLASGMDKTLDANGNVILVVNKLHNGTGWENMNERHYTYDANGKVLTHELKEWNGGTLENKLMDTYSYNSDGNILKSTSRPWDGTAYAVLPGSTDRYYYYGFPVSVGKAPATTQGIEVYPVPASSSFTIQMPGGGQYRAHLYDGMGRLVKTQTDLSTGIANLNVQDLPAGNYVLQVQAGGNVASQQVVIAK
jgi:hypothetical protein